MTILRRRRRRHDDGGAGDDAIEGGQGADIMTGGAGADMFGYQSEFRSSLPSLGGDSSPIFSMARTRST